MSQEIMTGSHLTPTTYGSEINPPFVGAILDEDGPGDDQFDIVKLALVPIFTASDLEYIMMEEAVRRGQTNADCNWGQRLAFRLRDEGNEGKISKDVWPIGICVVCSKTIWLNQSGFRVERKKSSMRAAWCVFRNEDGFNCSYRWFGNNIYRRSRFPSLVK